MNIAITESTPERVKGTFSGTLTRENPNNGDIYYTQITDGYFESIIEWSITIILIKNELLFTFVIFFTDNHA